MSEENTVGKNVRRLREEAGMSQSELWKAAGIGRSTLCGLEQGLRVNPSTSTLQALADALGVNVRDLLE